MVQGKNPTNNPKQQEYYAPGTVAKKVCFVKCRESLICSRKFISLLLDNQ